VSPATKAKWNHRVTTRAPTVPNLRGPDTTASTSIDRYPSADEKAAAAFQEAAASAGADEPPITGLIPLPKRRPIMHP
jgi:hypothetical protein